MSERIPDAEKPATNPSEPKTLNPPIAVPLLFCGDMSPTSAMLAGNIIAANTPQVSIRAMSIVLPTKPTRHISKP